MREFAKKLRIGFNRVQKLEKFGRASKRKMEIDVDFPIYTEIIITTIASSHFLVSLGHDLCDFITLETPLYFPCTCIVNVKGAVARLRGAQ